MWYAEDGKAAEAAVAGDKSFGATSQQEPAADRDTDRASDQAAIVRDVSAAHAAGGAIAGDPSNQVAAAASKDGLGSGRLRILVYVACLRARSGYDGQLRSPWADAGSQKCPKVVTQPS